MDSLGIPPKDQPPNHYRLLGLELFEENRNVIDAAANRQMSFVKEYQAGEASELSQKLLNELSAARLCLLTPDKKAAYDRDLRTVQKAKEAVPPLAGPAAGSRWRTDQTPENEAAVQPRVSPGVPRGPLVTPRPTGPTPLERPPSASPIAPATAGTVSTSPVAMVAPREVESQAPVGDGDFEGLPDTRVKIGVIGMIGGLTVAAIAVAIAVALPSVSPSPSEDPGPRVAEGVRETAPEKPKVVEPVSTVPPATFSPLPAAIADGNTPANPPDSERPQPAPASPFERQTLPPTPQRKGKVGEPSQFSVGSETHLTSGKVTERAPSPAKETVLVAAAEPAQKPPPAPAPTETLEEAEARLKAAADLAASPAVLEAVAQEMLMVADRAILDSRSDVARRLVAQALNVARKAEAGGVEKRATLLLVELARPLTDEMKASARQRLGERRISAPAAVAPVSPGVPAASSQPNAASSRRTLAVTPFGSAQARRFQEQAAAELGVPVEQTNSIGMRLILIPAGEFTMGSSEEEVAKVLEDNRRKNAAGWLLERYAAESPRHRVTITRPFYLGACEVTQDQFERVVGTIPSKVQDDPKRPVAGVTWLQADEFCRKLSELEKSAGAAYRLPTEAEWEYACRAGTTTRFSFGDAAELLGEYAWWRENSRGQSQPVGQLKPNAWGLFDVAGNQMEWCADRYAADYYANSPTEDPVNASSSGERVMRGGAAEFGNPDMFRCAFRHHSQPDDTYPAHGLRVARTLAP